MCCGQVHIPSEHDTVSERRELVVGSDVPLGSRIDADVEAGSHCDNGSRAAYTTSARPRTSLPDQLTTRHPHTKCCLHTVQAAANLLQCALQ